MSYFPAFIQLNQRKILLVGGGDVAFEKLQKLLDFSSDISVITKSSTSQFQLLVEKSNVVIQHRAYEKGDIKGYDIVIVAVDDISLQKAIYEESRDYRCLCNVVDVVEYCDFIFPSYFKKGDLSVAVSTSGSSPAMAKYLRQYLQAKVPDSIVNFLSEMKVLRKTLPKGKIRMKMLDEKAKKYMQDIES